MPYFVYILASKRNGTLYIGSTNHLLRRVSEHREGIRKGFAHDYGVTRLVHYEMFDEYGYAAQREKRLKKWKRSWKLALIEETNPQWRDLYDEVAEHWI